jgi:hypothetical protein
MEWMKEETRMSTCTFCGFTFDPELNPSCGSCPLHQDCSVACCPNCGISNIIPAKSKLANWINRILPGGSLNVKHPFLAKRND